MLMMGLRTMRGWAAGEFERAAGIAPEKLRPAVMAELEKSLHGLAERGFFEQRFPGFPKSYQLTAKGRFYYASAGSELMEAAASAWHGA